MPEQTKADLWQLSDLCTPWCIHVVATLRIADHIAAGHSRIEDLAEAAGCDAEYLRRVLSYLVEKGVFLEPASGQFALNDTAQELRDPATLVSLDLNGIGGRMAYAWGSLLSAVRTGKPAYHEIFGQPFWADLAAHPEVAESLDTLLSPAGHGIPDPEVLVSGSWDSVQTVVDVGGGTGTLLAEILRAHPSVQGILVEMPRTLARAEATFEAAGVADRVTLAGQSFFDPLPEGADLYLLKSVLPNWPDPEAVQILRRCAEAAHPDGRVIIVNGVTPDERAGSELLMMVLLGGKERTLPEFRELAQEAGLTVHATKLQPSGRFLVECRPV